MSQFINSYNTQNGMGNPVPPGQNYPGAWQPVNSGPNMGLGPQNVGPNQMMVQQNQPSVMGTAQNQNWKTYSPAPSMPPLVGRWVNNFDEIKPQDVPMDGSICFFPQSDYSCIYAMVWSNDGKIVPFRFIPEKNEAPIAQQQALPTEMNDILRGYEAISSNIFNKLDALDSRMTELYNSVAVGNSKTNRSKKVEREDEAT